MSSTLLSDLRAIAHHLDDERITVRKTHDDKLKDMLSNNHVLSALNDATLHGGTFTWTDLYRGAIRYLLREAKRIEKDLEKASNVPSTSTQSFHQKVKKQNSLVERLKLAPVALLQLIIKKANKSEPMIRCEVLVDDMISFLSHSNKFIRTHFGYKATLILTDKVLTQPKYRSEIRITEDHSGNQWKALVRIAFEIFEDIPDRLDFHSCCQFFRSLMIHSSKFTSTRNLIRTKINKLKLILESSELRQASVETKGIFFEGVNEIMFQLAPDYRLLLCEFGESVTSLVLKICGEDRTVSEPIVTFLLLQLSLHHPHGAAIEEEGFLFKDKALWHHSLCQVYSNLVDTTIRNIIRTNRTKMSKNYWLREDLVELAAGVARQIFFIGDKLAFTEVEVTQFVPPNVTQMRTGAAFNFVENTSEVDGPAAKKRKILIKLITEELVLTEQSGKSEESLIPWLQIIKRLLTKYPTVFASELNLEKTSSIFRAILGLLQTCRCLDVKDLLLRCANQILEIKAESKKEQEYLDKLIGSEFVKLWETTLNIVSLNQCIKEGHRLLRTMLLQARPEQVSKVYGLFLNNLIKCNEDSVETLLRLLIVSPQIPEVQKRAEIFPTQSTFSQSAQQYPPDSSRLILLEWLWPRWRSSENQESTIWISLRQSHPKLLSSVLTMFVTRVETEESRNFLLTKICEMFTLAGSSEETSQNFQQNQRELEMLENLYFESSLLTSRNLPNRPNGYHNPEMKDGLSIISRNGYHNPEMKDGLSIISRIKLNIHEGLVQESGDMVSSLCEKNLSKDEIYSNCLTSLDVIRFNILFIQTFHEWGIPINDEKSQRLTRRLIDVLQGLMDKTCSLMNGQFSNAVDLSAISSQFDSVAKKLKIVLEDVRSCSRFEERVSHLIDIESFQCMFGVVHASILTSSAAKIVENLSRAIVIRNGPTQNKTQKNMTAVAAATLDNEDVDFFDEVESTDNCDVMMEDEFEDKDLQNFELKSFESLIANSFHLLSQISVTLPKEIGLQKIENVVETMQRYLKKLTDLLKQNGAAKKTLNLFVVQSLFKIVEQVLLQTSYLLDIDQIQNILRLLKTVANLCIGKNFFEPDICSLMVQAMTQLLRHLNDDERENIEGSQSTLDLCRDNFKSLVGGLSHLQSMSSYQRYSQTLELDFVRLLGSITIVDPLGKWANFSAEIFNKISHDDRECTVDSDEPIPISFGLFRFVIHPSHLIRVAASKFLLKIFICHPPGSNIQHLMETKRQKLAQLYEYLVFFCNSTFRQDEIEFSSDERQNRCATFLMTMSSIAQQYPSLEWESAARILAPFSTFQIDFVFLKRVFDNLASSRSLNGSSVSYLEPMLPFILKEFLKQDKSWSEFPYKLLDCEDTEAFAQKYEKIILPVLLWFGKSGGNEKDVVKAKLVEFSNIIRKECSTLLIDNFSDLVSYFLPTYVANDKNPELLRGICTKKRIARAEQIHQLCEQQLTRQKYFSLMNEFMPEILSKILSHVQDPEALQTHLIQAGVQQDLIVKLLPLNQTSDPPSFHSILVKNLLEYFGEIVSEGEPLFGHLVDKLPDCIERILLSICGPLKSENLNVLPKMRSLHGLAILTMALSDELRRIKDSNNILIQQLPFITWYTVNTLLDFISASFKKYLQVSALTWDESAISIFLAFDILDRITNVLLSYSSNNLLHTKRIVLLVSNTLVPLVASIEASKSKNSDFVFSQAISAIQEMSLRSLSKMIIGSVGVFDAKKHLDRFPSTSGDIFRVLEEETGLRSDDGSSSLSDVIREFVDKGQIPFCGVSKSLHCKEGLSNLLLKLQSERNELDKMLKELAKGTGLSEEAATSTLHQLIGQLIDLSTSKCPDISEMATRCLGEIGPLNFGTLILNPKIKSDSKPVFIIKILLNYVISEDQATSTAASSALKHIMQTKEGSDGLEDAELVSLISPFQGPLCFATYDKNVASNSNPRPFNLELFVQTIDDENLWSGSNAATPEDWICNLVERLLATLPTYKRTQFRTAPTLGRHLAKLCKRQPNFCKKIFPLLIQQILEQHFHDELQVRRILSNQTNLFFEKHFHHPRTGSQKKKFVAHQNLSIIRMMLEMCGHLRLSELPPVSVDQKGQLIKSTAWQNNFWLSDVNYLHLAKAAFTCCDYFAAVMYADIWCHRQIELRPELLAKSAITFDSGNLLNFLYENLEDESTLSDVKVCQTILAESYQSLGHLDAIDGCGDERLLNEGARIQHLVNENQLYKALGIFDQLLATPSTSSNNAIHQYQQGLMSTLLSTGFYHTMNGYIAGTKKILGSQMQTRGFQQYQYECAWRLGQWDSLGDDDATHEKDGSTFSRHRILAMDSLLGENDNHPDFVRHLVSARKQVGADLSSLKNCESSCTSAMKPLTQLRSLRELEIISQLMPKLTKRGSEVDSNLSNRVEFNLQQLSSYSNLLFSSPTSSDFDDSEHILSQRCVALAQMANKQRLDNVIESPVKKKQVDLLKVRRQTSSAYLTHALQLSKVARENGRFQIAHNNLSQMKQLLKNIQAGGKFANILDETSLLELEFAIGYEESLLMWDWKEKDLAKKQLKNLQQILKKQYIDTSICPPLLPEALGTLGAWMSELRTESSSVIMDKYLTESVRLFETLLGETVHQDKMVEAYSMLAKFCDEQYQQLSQFMKSKDFEEKQNLMAQIRAEIKSIKDIGTTVKDTRQAAVILERNHNLDNNEVDQLKANLLQYLLSALQNYCNALRMGNKHDLKTYRLISLWFSNMADEQVNQKLGDWLIKIPSHKFIGLLYQLCARMVTKSVTGVHATAFPKTLLNLIERCAKDHPYHALPIILALANSDADQAEIEAEQTMVKPVAKRFKDDLAVSPGGSRSKTKGNNLEGKEERTLAANFVLNKLRSNHDQLVQDNQKLAISLIKLAYTTDSKGANTGKVQIDRSHPIRKIKNLSKVSVPTLNIPVNPDGRYGPDSFVSVVEFAPEYQMVGGINAPKKIKCLGSDGKWRPQLVKGRDDLRQDAVMQQVFSLINTLLQKDPNTMKRRLHIRQYKVVPLSQRSGILEWCEDTMVLRDYLIGENGASGAHKRYHPDDLTGLQCRKVLQDTAAEAQKNKSKSHLVKMFLEICNKFKPALKYFFYEYFPSPGLYFERRLAYSRSTATSSMVGYILGLGDRHVQNILIDKKTAEMIHIDLGIAFEQGRILPTPETIPFRLTRDVVDGFGPSGVEGTFRRSCESTMKVLRSHKDEILTILEVLMYDPLYNWSLTPAKAYRLQTGKEADANLKAKWEMEAKKKRELDGKNGKGSNSMAERVLIRVSQKLNGSEDGSYLSIEGQVNSLIQQARDPERLAIVFPGWQPYI